MVLLALDCLVVAPWWTEWRWWRTAFLSFLGITRHWSIKTMSPWTERQFLTSQYCWMSDGMSCHILGNPAWIVLISCWYSGSALLALFRDSIVISLLLGGVSQEVQLMVASETAQTMSVVASIFSASCKDS